MHLERVEIVGFRGINRLSLMLEQNNVLIGENAWGKSSLLDALTLLLSPGDLYHFVTSFGFARRCSARAPPHIILTFRQSNTAAIVFGASTLKRLLGTCDGYQRFPRKACR